MDYIRFSQGIGKYDLIPSDQDIYENIDLNKDYFTSIFYYNDQHYKQFKETGSIAGITDVTTDRLVWDFDSADVEQARLDAKELCNRIIETGISKDAIQASFSGSKGYHIELRLNTRITPEQNKNLKLYYAKDLKSHDTQILDPARIFRVVGTRHAKSKLYKFPLNLDQLYECNSEFIKTLAQDINNAEQVNYEIAVLPADIMKIAKEVDEPKLKLVDVVSNDIDFKFKPKGFSNCKFAILNGMFPSGTRNNALKALASTCKAQGYPKEVTYRMLKGAAELQGRRYGVEPFLKDEIWNTIIQSTYSSAHQGGQYSCKNQEWLKTICDGLGSNRCKPGDDKPFLQISDMYSDFEKYAVEIEKNTIKTGIKELDEKAQLTIGMPVGLLGSPSSGKTSLALSILNSTSLQGTSSVFFSMDMYGPLVYKKQIQKHTGLVGKEIDNIFKHDKKKANEIKALLNEQYKNVRFSLKSGHTVQDMREIISDHEQTSGEKVKLVLIDYLECISGPYSDATANTAKVAGELRDFATEMSICNIVLVQPPKSAGDASCALTSMRQIKGASMLEQSFRVIFGIHRDGFGPQYPEDDKFLTINCLKNTMGELFSQDYYWDGRKGDIFELDEIGEQDLRGLRKRKEMASKGNKDEWS